MAEDEYTLMSSKDVSELKQDVEYLKKNPLGGSKEGKSLLESINKLNESMEHLIEIFKEASEEMKAEEREADVLIKSIQPIEQKLEELSDQNQKIAKGILAVADMVGAKEEQPRPPQRLPQLGGAPRPAMPMPRPAMPPRTMPQPMPPKLPPMGGMPPSMPPPPGMPMAPKKEEKKGLLAGLFKKK